LTRGFEGDGGNVGNEGDKGEEVFFLIQVSSGVKKRIAKTIKIIIKTKIMIFFMVVGY